MGVQRLTLMREAIYKGATRPPMLFGIPLIPFILVSGFTALVSIWGAVLLSKWIAIVAIPCAFSLLMWMRHMSAKDDQRLRQLMLKLKLHMRAKNLRIWKCRSYAPYRFRGTRDDYAR